jgi:hypothetical protein
MVIVSRLYITLACSQEIRTSKYQTGFCCTECDGHNNGGVLIRRAIKLRQILLWFHKSIGLCIVTVVSEIIAGSNMCHLNGIDSGFL